MPLFNPSQRATRRTTTELMFYPRMVGLAYGKALDPTVAEALGGLVGTVGSAVASEALKTEQAYQAQQAVAAARRQDAEDAKVAAQRAETTKTTATWLIGTVLVITVGSVIYKKYGRA